MPQNRLHLGIIGGGAVGVSAVCNAVIESLSLQRPVTIYHFEQSEPIADQEKDGCDIATGGIAYNRADWEMKVNRQVKEMGLLPTRDELHLLKWLQTTANRVNWPAEWQHHAFTENDFLPRPIVDQYVRHCYLQSLQDKTLFSNFIDIQPIRAEVVDIEPTRHGAKFPGSIITESGDAFPVHHVLAACGQFRTSIPAFAEDVADHPSFIGYLWERGRDRPELDPAKKVLTVGTGLGGMDVMRTRWFKAGLKELIDVLETAHPAKETRALLEALANKYGFDALRDVKDLAPTYRFSRAATTGEIRQIVEGLIDAGELEPMILTSRHLNLHFGYEDDFVARPLPLPPLDINSLPTDIDEITTFANNLIAWADREVVGNPRFGNLTWEDILWTVQPYIPMLLARVEPNQNHIQHAFNYEEAKIAAQRELLDRFHSFLTTHHIGMPKETVDIYDKMVKYGLLIPVAGHMQPLDASIFSNLLFATILSSDSTQRVLFDDGVDAVINAIQPNSDVMHPDNQLHLLRTLVDLGLARPHKWGIGIEVNERMQLMDEFGDPVDWITIISGASMVGSLLEQFGLLTFAASLEVSAWIAAQATARAFGREPENALTAVNSPKMFQKGATVCLPGRPPQQGHGDEFMPEVMGVPDASQLPAYWQGVVCANGTHVDAGAFERRVITGRHPLP